MTTRRAIPDEVYRLALELERLLERGVDEARWWLATPQGRRFRQVVARALIVGGPLMFRHRIFRRTLLGRAVELVGGAALLVKIAELIRDWEPEPPAA